MNKTNFYFCCNDSIAEIQSSFSQFYPSLGISFFSNNEKTQPNNAWVMLSPEIKIRDISPDSRDGYIVLNNKMTITDLESSIQDHFKLHVEISPIMGKQQFIDNQAGFRPLRPNNSERLRLPERPNTTCFKNVPFGC
jgi:hypothetical protein